MLSHLDLICIDDPVYPAVQVPDGLVVSPGYNSYSLVLAHLAGSIKAVTDLDPKVLGEMRSESYDLIRQGWVNISMEWLQARLIGRAHFIPPFDYMRDVCSALISSRDIAWIATDNFAWPIRVKNLVGGKGFQVHTVLPDELVADIDREKINDRLKINIGTNDINPEVKSYITLLARILRSYGVNEEIEALINSSSLIKDIRVNERVKIYSRDNGRLYSPKKSVYYVSFNLLNEHFSDIFWWAHQIAVSQSPNLYFVSSSKDFEAICAEARAKRIRDGKDDLHRKILVTKMITTQNGIPLIPQESEKLLSQEVGD